MTKRKKDGVALVQKKTNETERENSRTPAKKQHPNCPECGSGRLYRDGIRYLKDHDAVQRWLCRKCGFRFSDPKREDLNRSNMIQHVQHIHRLNLRRADPLVYSCQVSARSRNEAKNLVKVETRQKRPMREGTTQQADVKGKILEFLWELKKQGHSEATIRTYGQALNRIVRIGANVFDPESVKEELAKQKFSEALRHIIIAAYSKFLKVHGGTWEPPICNVTRKLPFIPLEREIDDLIAGCGKKTTTLLQVLKETAMRAGEALRLKWTDIDFKRRIIIFNEPEKHGNPRVFQISPKLIEMLNAMPKESHKIFNSTYTSAKSNYVKSRKRLARKLGNPRLQRITFHTLRHWKATTTYHKTKDPLYVKEMLGHKSLNTTLIYIQLEKTLFKETSDEFTVKVAQDPERIKDLLQVGFEYVCEKDGLIFFKKRK